MLTTLLLLIGLAQVAGADGSIDRGELSNVIVGDGPLLTFHAPFDEPDSRTRHNRLFVTDVETGAAPQRLWMGTGSRLNVLERIDRNTVIVEWFSRERGAELWRVDLANGERTVFAAGPQIEWLEWDGDRAWYLVHQEAVKQWGTKLRASAVDANDCGVELYARPKMRLYSSDLVDACEAVLAFDERIEVVLAVTREDLWVITQAEPSALWRVSRGADRAARHIARLPDRWVTSMLALSFSPGGRYAAIGATPREHFYDRREYAVFNLGEENGWTPAADSLRVFSNRHTNNVRTLEPDWIDEHRFRWDGAVEKGAVDVRTGVRFDWDRKEHDFVRAMRDYPSMNDRERVGRFLRIKDQIEVAANDGEEARCVALRDSDYHAFEWSVSPDGEWMAASSPRLRVVPAATGIEHVVFASWSCELRWLAAIHEQAAPLALTDDERLHAALGRDVVVRGVAMHSPKGPFLRTADGRDLYLADQLAHAPGMLGLACTATGKLKQRSAVDLRESVWSGIGERFGGVYVLLDAQVVPDESSEPRWSDRCAEPRRDGAHDSRGGQERTAPLAPGWPSHEKTPPGRDGAAREPRS